MGYSGSFRAKMRKDSGQSCLRSTTLWLLGTVVMATSAWPSLVRAAEPTAPVDQPAPAKASDVSGYLSVGLGGSNVGLTARGMFTLAKGSWFAAVNAGYGNEFNLFTGPSPSLEQQDLGVVAGWHCRGGFHFIALGLGLGYVHSINRGRFEKYEDGLSASHASYERIDRVGIGIPLIAHGGLHLGSVGVGGMVFANVNLTLPSIGAAGTLNLGSF